MKNDNFGGTVTVEKDFGNLTLLSVTSYQEYDRWQPKESDGTPELYVDLLFTSEIWAFSQEVRLTSHYDGPFNWIVGANYGRDEVAELPGRIAYFDAYPFLPGRGELTYEQDRENIAAYGQFTMNLGEQWRFSAGGRVLKDDVTFTQDVRFEVPAWNLVITNQLPRTIVNPDGSIEELDGKLDDTAVTWRVALDYLPNDNILVYASVATGYKPGGFNAGFSLNALQYLPFIHEEVTAIELGLKSTVANGRAIFNAAAFTYDYDGMQAATPRVHQGIVFNSLDNLAEADVEGFEADIHWRPVDALDIKLGVSFLDTMNNDPRSNFDGATGDSPRRLADSPEQTFNAAVAYEIPLANGGMVRLFGDYYYQVLSGESLQGGGQHNTLGNQPGSVERPDHLYCAKRQMGYRRLGPEYHRSSLGRGHVEWARVARLGRSRIRCAAQLRRNRQLALGSISPTSPDSINQAAAAPHDSATAIRGYLGFPHAAVTAQMAGRHRSPGQSAKSDSAAWKPRCGVAGRAWPAGFRAALTLA